jgi:branched-chain amino acid transport system permease protein
MALGLTIIYGVIHLFNFGHGIVAVLGGYFTWLLLTNTGLGLIPSIFIALVIMFFLGLILFRAAISPLLKSPTWEFSTIIFLLGLGILLENLILQAFGPRVKQIPQFFEGGLRIGFLRVNWHEISLILIVFIFIVLLNYLLKRPGSARQCERWLRTWKAPKSSGSISIEHSVRHLRWPRR